MRRTGDWPWWPALVAVVAVVTYGINTHASPVYWAAWSVAAVAVGALAWAERRSASAHRVWLWRWWPAAIWVGALVIFGRNAYAGFVPPGIWIAWLGFGGIYAAATAVAVRLGRHDMPADERRERIGIAWIFEIAVVSLAVATLIVDALRGVWW